MITLKSQEDLKHIRKACRIAGGVLAEVARKVKEGISTLELDQLAEKLILKEGAKPAFKGYRGYKFATCLSVNEEVVHGIPSKKKKLVSGDIIGVDIGTQVNGYFGDVAATVFVGQPTEEIEKLVKSTQEALYRAIAEVRAGKKLGDISYAIQSFAETNGYCVVRNLFGHGVGKALHEDPLIPNFGKPNTGVTLRPGMVLAIEPMFNMGGCEIETMEDGWTVLTKDRRASAHFEHTVLVTDGDPEIMTAYA